MLPLLKTRAIIVFFAICGSCKHILQFELFQVLRKEFIPRLRSCIIIDAETFLAIALYLNKVVTVVFNVFVV